MHLPWSEWSHLFGIVFHDSLLRPEISNKRITKQIPTSPVFRTAYFIIQSWKLVQSVGKFLQILLSCWKIWYVLEFAILFLNGRRPPTGDDTGALHIPSLHPSARLGNITQIEDRRNNQSCLNVQRPTGNVVIKRRFLTRETAVIVSEVYRPAERNCKLQAADYSSKMS